jgi:hypothetical protein
MRKNFLYKFSPRKKNVMDGHKFDKRLIKRYISKKSENLIFDVFIKSESHIVLYTQLAKSRKYCN